MARACDRCSRLKTMCNGGNIEHPCSRCERLDLECTQTRPVLAKGRPKRDTSDIRPRKITNNARPSPSQSSSPQSIHPDVLAYPPPTEHALRLARLLKDSPLPESITAYLLDLTFPPASNLGILEVFLQSNGGLLLDRSNPLLVEGSTLYHESSSFKSLLYSLVVVGATLSSLQDPSINIFALHRTAMTSIPVMQFDSRTLQIDDALALCLLSNASCFSLGALRVADRLAVLACSVADQADYPQRSFGHPQYHARVRNVIYLNDCVFALLHNRHPIRSSDASNESQLYKEQDRLEHSTHDKMSIVGVLDQPTVERSRCLEVDYFSLYMPLLSPFQVALGELVYESAAWNDAMHRLDMFAKCFPPSISHYNAITTLHQIEACIWYHGIMIILYGKKDLYNYFSDVQFNRSHLFLTCLEHAQLMGEAIPTLARIMKTSAELSPATVYFLLLSTVVHGVALLHCLQPTVPQTATNGNSSPIRQESVAKLIESTHLHLFLLRRIRDTLPSCGLDLLQIVERVLQPIYIAATTNSTERVEVDTSQLRCYRWTRDGHGINKMTSDEGVRNGREYMTNGYHQSRLLTDVDMKREIMALFDVSTRKIGLGQFCKSIVHQ